MRDEERSPTPDELAPDDLAPDGPAPATGPAETSQLPDAGEAHGSHEARSAAAEAELNAFRADPESHAAPRIHHVPAWLWRTGLAGWLTLGIVVLIGLAWFAASQILLVVMAVFIGLLLTSILTPVVNLLARVIPRFLAALLALLALFATLVAVLTWVVTSVLGQTGSIAEQFRTGLGQITHFLEHGPLPFHVTQDEVVRWFEGVVDDGVSWLQRNAGNLVTTALSNFEDIALAFTVVLLAVFVALFFLATGGRMWHWTVNQFPDRMRVQVHLAAGAAWYTFAGYTRGIMIVAVSNALLGGLILTLVGVPLAAPLATLVFIGSFIPLFGAPIAMGVAMVVALATQGWVAALVVGGGIALVGQVEGHILQPLIMGKQVSIHPVVVALGVTAGTILGGIFGAIIAIPLLSVGWAVWSTLHEPDPPVRDGALPDALAAARARVARRHAT